MFSTGEILRVVGVIGEPSSKSFLDFDLLVNQNLRPQKWIGMNHNLVMLNKSNDVDKVNKSNSTYSKLKIWEKPVRFQLATLKDVYLENSIYIYSVSNNSIFKQGNINSIKVLSIVSLLILFVGLFNFINIYSVINMKREREFGIKKIYGASLPQIASQFLFENLIMVLVAIFCAWFLTELSSTILAERLSFSVKPNMQFDIWLSISIIFILSLLMLFISFRVLSSASQLPSATINSSTTGNTDKITSFIG